MPRRKAQPEPRRWTCAICPNVVTPADPRYELNRRADSYAPPQRAVRLCARCGALFERAAAKVKEQRDNGERIITTNVA